MKKIGFDHFNYLTDDFGIWQHTDGKKIDKKHGYALDDSARALLLASNNGLEEKINIYVNFLDLATKNNPVVNFFSPSRTVLPNPWSEDALGETYWALAELYDKHKISDADKIIKRITPLVDRFTSLRGRAYALIGATKVNFSLAKKLFRSIEQDFVDHRRTNWNWLENSLSYANAIVPLSLLEYAEFNKCESAKIVGLALLDFLNRVTKMQNKPFVIGNRGWFKKGLKKAVFDQQPIDAGYQVLANIKAYEVCNDKKYLQEARQYFSWFWGNNIKGSVLIDLSSYGCFDGIREDGLSKNMGAESIICYLLAQERIWPYLQENYQFSITK